MQNLAKARVQVARGQRTDRAGEARGRREKKDRKTGNGNRSTYDDGAQSGTIFPGKLPGHRVYAVRIGGRWGTDHLAD